MIGPTDIIPLINRVFHNSYGSINSNLNTLADQGWNPLNRKLLEHNELIDDSAPVIEHSLTESTPNNSAQSTSNSSGRSINLNIHEGMAATVLDRMVAERARPSQAKKQQMRGRGKVNLFFKT
jgi:hypothetical protein